MALYVNIDLVESFGVTVTTELKDITNDFRTRTYYDLYDINNDIRIRPYYSLYDINNDFRIFSNIVRVDITNDFRIVTGILSNINNKFNTAKTEAKDFTNKFNSVIEVISDVTNYFNSSKEIVADANNDFRTIGTSISDITNDFRMLSAWQLPLAGQVGFQSSGKTAVILYINDVEQTDADLNSISITQVLNSAFTANFNLGRAYDATKPAMESIVKIKYQNFLLFKGYITEINPTDSPESIKINCQGEYWNLNKTKKFFFVGRKPADTNEYYYDTIKLALSNLGFSYNIGDFIPPVIDLYDTGIADGISRLVPETGNFGWFITPNGDRRLWEAGKGNVVNLEKQSIGTKIGLYQVIKQNFRESIVGIVNKFRVLMGNKTVRQSSTNAEASGAKSYYRTKQSPYISYIARAWDYSLERLTGKNNQYGWDNQDPNINYKDVFKKFWLPQLSSDKQSWSNRKPPIAKVDGIITKDGFTIDYQAVNQLGYFLPAVIFSEPQVEYVTNQHKELIGLRTKNIEITLVLETKESYSKNPQSNPDTTPIPEDNSLIFYTDKMGTYSETIVKDLELSNLSIQEGYIIKEQNIFPYNFKSTTANTVTFYSGAVAVISINPNLISINYSGVTLTPSYLVKNSDGSVTIDRASLYTSEAKIIENVPDWNDTEYAKDYANFQLSKSADKKVSGSVELTIDAMVYYGIDLSKRITIDNVVNEININSITYNIGSFTAILTLENKRFYKRTKSIAYRGQ